MNSSLGKIGGACSILTGISFLVVGAAYLLIPADQRPGTGPAKFFPSFNADPTASMLLYWGLALGSVFALGAVPAIAELVRAKGEGWVRWTTNLAFLGFAVIAIDNFRAIGVGAQRAADYVAGDAATKTAIAAGQGLISLDPQGYLGFGGVGLWLLAVNALAMRERVLPTPATFVGAAVAVAGFLVVAGFVFRVETLIAIAALVGGVVAAPIYYIWTGIVLRSAPREAMAPAARPVSAR